MLWSHRLNRQAKAGALIPEIAVEQAADKLLWFVIPSEAKNLSSIQAQEKMRDSPLHS
jgi:hypothetical protein